MFLPEREFSWGARAIELICLFVTGLLVLFFAASLSDMESLNTGSLTAATLVPWLFASNWFHSLAAPKAPFLSHVLIVAFAGSLTVFQVIALTQWGVWSLEYWSGCLFFIPVGLIFRAWLKSVDLLDLGTVVTETKESGK